MVWVVMRLQAPSEFDLDVRSIIMKVIRERAVGLKDLNGAVDGKEGSVRSKGKVVLGVPGTDRITTGNAVWVWGLSLRMQDCSNEIIEPLTRFPINPTLAGKGNKINVRELSLKAEGFQVGESLEAKGLKWSIGYKLHTIFILTSRSIRNISHG